MKLRIFCPLWGSRHLPFEVFARQVAEAGYDGIEMNLPLGTAEKAAILSTLKDFGLQWIGQHFETLDADFIVHRQRFEHYLRNLLEAQPRLINSHTGRDIFSVDQNEELIGLAARLADQYGIPIVHETHRGNFSFAAHLTKGYLQRLPGLRLALDISHWYCVAESFLDDQPEAVALAIERTDHIHARIGFTQGPQITDPRAPEWQSAIRHHLACWQRVAELQQANGKTELTLTTEFGAPPYLAVLPFSQQPIVSQWELNRLMKELIEQSIQID